MALATKGKSTQRQSSLNVPNHSFSFHTLLANFYLLFAALSHCVFPLLFDFIVGLLAVGFLVRSSRLILRLGFGFALTGCPATALASSPALQPQLPQRFIKLYNLTPFQLANVVGVLFTFALGQITQNSTGVAATKAIDSQPASSVACCGSGSGSGFGTVYVSLYQVVSLLQL